MPDGVTSEPPPYHRLAVEEAEAIHQLVSARQRAVFVLIVTSEAGETGWVVRKSPMSRDQCHKVAEQLSQARDVLAVMASRLA